MKTLLALWDMGECARPRLIARAIVAVVVVSLSRPTIAQETPAGLSAPIAAAEAQPPLAPGLRPRIAKLKDLEPFARQDLVVAERVQRIERRRLTAFRWLLLATTSGLVAGVLATAHGTTSCHFLDANCEPRPLSTTGAEVLGVSALGFAIIGVVLLARNGTAQETMELWNRRHPEAPLRWELAPVEAAKSPAHDQ